VVDGSCATSRGETRYCRSLNDARGTAATERHADDVAGGRVAREQLVVLEIESYFVGNQIAGCGYGVGCPRTLGGYLVWNVSPQETVSVADWL